MPIEELIKGSTFRSPEDVLEVADELSPDSNRSSMLPVAIVSLSAVLAGCGSPTAEPTPTPGPVEPTAEPTEEPEPTEEQPTETPAATQTSAEILASQSITLTSESGYIFAAGTDSSGVLGTLDSTQMEELIAGVAVTQTGQAAPGSAFIPQGSKVRFFVNENNEVPFFTLEDGSSMLASLPPTLVIDGKEFLPDPSPNPTYGKYVALDGSTVQADTGAELPEGWTARGLAMVQIEKPDGTIELRVMVDVQEQGKPFLGEARILESQAPPGVAEAITAPTPESAAPTQAPTPEPAESNLPTGSVTLPGGITIYNLDFEGDGKIDVGETTIGGGGQVVTAIKMLPNGRVLVSSSGGTAEVRLEDLLTGSSTPAEPSEGTEIVREHIKAQGVVSIMDWTWRSNEAGSARARCPHLTSDNGLTGVRTFIGIGGGFESLAGGTLTLIGGRKFDVSGAIWARRVMGDQGPKLIAVDPYGFGVLENDDLIDVYPKGQGACTEGGAEEWNDAFFQEQQGTMGAVIIVISDIQ